MENYTDFLKNYLKGRRNISRKCFKKGFRFYRAISNEIITLEYAERIVGGAN